jgi:hypothetical protein
LRVVACEVDCTFCAGTDIRWRLARHRRRAHDAGRPSRRRARDQVENPYGSSGGSLGDLLGVMPRDSDMAAAESFVEKALKHAFVHFASDSLHCSSA